MISSPAAQLEAFGDVSRISIILVAVPLMIFAAVATHFTSRASIARQVDTGTVNPQTAIMNKLALWVFPVGVIAFGAFAPVAILLYFVSNNRSEERRVGNECSVSVDIGGRGIVKQKERDDNRQGKLKLQVSQTTK